MDPKIQYCLYRKSDTYHTADNLFKSIPYLFQLNIKRLLFVYDIIYYFYHINLFRSFIYYSYFADYTSERGFLFKFIESKIHSGRSPLINKYF